MENIRVLVCDDSVFVRKKLTSFLQTLDDVAEIYEASDGFEAVAQYKEHSPTVVFMDIVMPNKTGIEALGEIMDFDPDARVYMASSVGTQNYLKDAINAGATDFLQKPIANDDVEKIIEMLVEEED